MIGIYKITNQTNDHCYIGQSRNIKNRWADHKASAFNPADKGYNYPLYRAFRKYGLEMFNFEIIEECSIEELNDKEKYWISYFHPEYNQTAGEDYRSVPQSLTFEQVQEIQQILINDKEGKISHKELGEKYGVSGKDTIRDINVGRTWYNPNLIYPLHHSNYDKNTEHHNYKYTCKLCGKRISYGSTYCAECYPRTQRVANRPNREELKALIRNTPFTTIGKKYNVTDNAVRKWCIAEKLPSKRTEIKKYSDLEWQNI